MVEIESAEVVVNSGPREHTARRGTNHDPKCSFGLREVGRRLQGPSPEGHAGATGPLAWRNVPAPGPRPSSALPSVRARILAFTAIIVAGAAGAAIGGSVVNVQCHGNCDTPIGIGAVVGGGIAAGGTGVVATLTLRAMGEWRRISEDELAGGDDEPDGDG